MGKCRVITKIGQQYGRLTVIHRAKSDDHGRAHWLCCCSCGQDRIVGDYSLKIGDTTSCGCRQRDTARIVGIANTTHGHTKNSKRSATFRSWYKMLRRCSDPKGNRYHCYGGRGINVCERWLGTNGFQHFLDDMGERPDSLTLERIDNDGNYKPGNCCWATRKEQNRNTRRNRNLTFRRKTQSVAAWAEQLGIPIHRIYGRLRRGWSVERALTEPVRKRGKVA